MKQSRHSMGHFSPNMLTTSSAKSQAAPRPGKWTWRINRIRRFSVVQYGDFKHRPLWLVGLPPDPSGVREQGPE